MQVQVGQSTALEIDHTHHLDEVSDGVEEGEGLRPMWHAVDGCKESAQQYEYNHAEEGTEHGLLLGRRDGRYGEPEAGEGNEVDGGKEVNDAIATCWSQTIDDIAYHDGYGEQNEAHGPEGDEFGEKENGFGNRTDIDLLDGALFFFADNVEGREKAADYGEQEHHDARHHEDFVAEVGIVELDARDALPYGSCCPSVLGIEILYDGCQI